MGNTCCIEDIEALLVPWLPLRSTTTHQIHHNSLPSPAMNILALGTSKRYAQNNHKCISWLWQAIQQSCRPLLWSVEFFLQVLTLSCIRLLRCRWGTSSLHQSLTLTILTATSKFTIKYYHKKAFHWPWRSIPSALYKMWCWSMPLTKFMYTKAWSTVHCWTTS